jgi:hypothetical protein
LTKRERLESAGLLKPDAELTQEQLDAVESLTDDEIDALISVDKKLTPDFDKLVEQQVLVSHKL